jgi:hypothetical protein
MFATQFQPVVELLFKLINHSEVIFVVVVYFTPLFSPQCRDIQLRSSYNLVSSQQHPNGLRRGKGRVMRPTKHDPPTPLLNTNLTRKPAAPMCQREHRSIDD